MPPPSLSPERAKVAKFYSARSRIIPPLPWQTFALPFSTGFVEGITIGIEGAKLVDVLMMSRSGVLETAAPYQPIKLV